MIMKYCNLVALFAFVYAREKPTTIFFVQLVSGSGHIEISPERKTNKMKEL